MTRERIELILFLVCSRSKSEMKVKCQNIHIFLPLFLLLLVDYVLYVGNTRYVSIRSVYNPIFSILVLLR